MLLDVLVVAGAVVAVAMLSGFIRAGGRLWHTERRAAEVFQKARVS